MDRILIVGLGSIGRRHLRLARERFPNADIRVLSRQERLPVPEYATGCFSDMSRAVAFAPQIAVIASPAPFHVQAAQRLANAGAHLLVEKPLSDSLEGVPELLEIVRSQGTVLLTGYNLRFLPSLRTFREMLKAEAVGRIMSVRCEIGQYLPSWRPDADYRLGVSAQKKLGGGALLELSHEIDYLRWIFGETAWVEATLSRQSSLEIDVEDTAHLILGFAPAPDGRQIIGTVSMDFIRHDTTRMCTAIGENGSLRWNGLTGVVEQFDAGGKSWRECFRHQHQRDESYQAEWAHLLECVERRAQPLISGEDGLMVMQLIEAVRKSSKTEARIRLVEAAEKAGA